MTMKRDGLRIGIWAARKLVAGCTYTQTTYLFSALYLPVPRCIRAVLRQASYFVGAFLSKPRYKLLLHVAAQACRTRALEHKFIAPQNYRALWNENIGTKSS